MKKIKDETNSKKWEEKKWQQKKLNFDSFGPKKREKTLDCFKKKMLDCYKKKWPVNKKKSKTHKKPLIWPVTQLARTRLNQSQNTVRVGLHFPTRGLSRFEVLGPYRPKSACCPSLYVVHPYMRLVYIWKIVLKIWFPAADSNINKKCQILKYDIFNWTKTYK
jgi:hypothetical protein